MALSDKQQAFAEHVADGLSPPDAARAAGYKDGPRIGVQASRNLVDPEIRGEIDRLLEKNPGRRWTEGRILLELETLYFKAKDESSFVAARDLLKMIAQHTNGMFVEKAKSTVEHKHTVEFEQLLDAAGPKDITPSVKQIKSDVVLS